MTATTKDKLIAQAALLFQERGFHGVGVADILAASGVPKGSLYHHFKEGKADLAIAAASWTSTQMLRIINDAFAEARDLDDGITTLCHKLAKLFDMAPVWRACPIAAGLFDGPDNPRFRAATADIFATWIDTMAGHGARLGDRDVQRRARAAFVAIQGAWTLAHAQGASDVLREVPVLLQIAPANPQSS